MQALQDAVGWTIGGFDTRPLPEVVEQKKRGPAAGAALLSARCRGLAREERDVSLE